MVQFNFNSTRKRTHIRYFLVSCLGGDRSSGCFKRLMKQAKSEQEDQIRVMRLNQNKSKPQQDDGNVMKMDVQKDDQMVLDKTDKMETEPSLSEGREGHTDNPLNMIVMDIAKEIEPGQEDDIQMNDHVILDKTRECDHTDEDDSKSDNSDDIYVIQGENSVSKSDQNKGYHGATEGTEPTDNQKQSFHE
eukprot:512808_1